MIFRAAIIIGALVLIAVGTQAMREALLDPAAIRVAAADEGWHCPMRGMAHGTARFTTVSEKISTDVRTDDEYNGAASGNMNRKDRDVRIAICVLMWIVFAAAGGCHSQTPVSSGDDDPPDEGPTTADPLVRFLWPKAGHEISNDTRIRVSATDDEGVAELRFTVDGEPIGTLHEAPWELDWAAEPWADGLWHEIRVGATDTDGNTAHAQISVKVIDPVPTFWHAMHVDSSGSGLRYEAEVWLSRAAALDSIRIRELDGAEWVSHHVTPFDGGRLRAQTRVAVPGNGESYPVVAPIYEITVYGRTVYFTERPFDVRQRERF